MLSSIEPGFYKENEYGIRLEDDALVIDVGDGYISFEKLNLAMCYQFSILVPYSTMYDTYI